MLLAIRENNSSLIFVGVEILNVLSHIDIMLALEITGTDATDIGAAA